MTDAPLLYDVQGHVATITLNRPEKMNAFNTEMLDLWQESILSAHSDEGVRVVIVTGNGRGFCSGADVSSEGAGTDVLGRDPAAPANNRNNLRNNKATAPEKQCNFTDEIRVQKLQEVAARIIKVSLETGIKPEVSLGFFNALDWQHLAEGGFAREELRRCIAYAEKIHEQMQSGVRLVEVSELEKSCR